MNNIDKNKVLRLYKDGYTLAQISINTGLSKTTIYYHTRKQFGRKYKLITISDNREKIGEFIGVFTGDGYFIKDKIGHYKTMITVSIKASEYIKHLDTIFTELFSKSPLIIKRLKYNTVELRYDSKEIYELIKNYLFWDGKKHNSVRLLVIEHDKEFLTGFLRGCLDTDGHVHKNYKRICFSTTSLFLANQLSSILTNLGFENKILIARDKRLNRKLLYNVRLLGEEAIRLIKTIKPGNPSKRRDWCE
ncbi:MAG: hypothetical protein KJ697_03285 [Nanoarchaeota archaeon]|nr:hypothetical protein [Nanoarchaeota archaeon]MBU4124062.1 hypothetical protein [Nanoarchaeota archaeon]